MVTDTNTTGAQTPRERSMRTGDESISNSTADLASQAQGKMSGLLRGQMKASADYVHMVSETAHSFADDLEDKAPELARYMHRAADRADQFAEEFRHRSPDEIFNAASDYARRNPRIFFGGAIALGFVLSRFLKSGSDQTQAYSAVRQQQGGRVGGSMGSSMGSSTGGAGSVSGAQPSTTRREFGQGSEGSPARGSGQTREDASREGFSNAR